MESFTNNLSQMIPWSVFVSLPPYKLITNDADWQACLKQLQSESQVAIDLEANSMYAYREQICLIQISIPEQDFIIDPVAPIDLSGLGGIIADAAIEKVFHAAEYDLILMTRQFGWTLRSLFDTMWAARILGYERYGLANILDTVYQVKLDKRYQKSNWCKRPLTSDQLAYAQHDTHFLLSLRDHLAKELEQANRMDEAALIFKEQSQVSLSDNTFDPDSFWALKGARKLSPQQQAILKELHIYRNEQAMRRNQPLFKIFSNKTLVELATKMPSRPTHLRSIHGMSSGQVRRYGSPLLAIIKKGKQLPPPARPKRKKRPPEDVMQRFDKLHQWRKESAQERGVESDVIISREALWSMAKEFPQTVAELAQIDLVGQWRCDNYGSEILQLLNGDD